MHELVIRGGTVVDGTGAPRRTADVAIDGGVITTVGRAERGRREVDADGLVVAPGWVDVHTHYDGQVEWDPVVSSSSWHGVTTVVMGNCGVGFAPVKPDEHDWLVGLMEGVEDIPGTALHEGISWEWETFPEYMDAIGRRPRAIDVAAQLPHGAMRAYVMGERGADHEAEPDADEIADMYGIVRAAIEAGALGFTSSRTRNHRTRDGAFTPSLTAGPDELTGIASALRDAGAGVLQFVADFRDVDTEFALLRSLAEHSGRPLSLSLSAVDNPGYRGSYTRVLELIEECQADGLAVKAQVPARAIGLMLGLDATLNPFLGRPSYMAIAHLPLAARVAEMRKPEVRARIVEEGGRSRFGFDNMFLLGDPPVYEPDPATSVAARADREGRDPSDLAYDLLLEQDGRALLYAPLLNWIDGSLDTAEKLMRHPFTVPGLSDGGAHCGTICDVSFPTFLVTHWTRDRDRGRFSLEEVVKAQCADTAALVGLGDRGVLAPGYAADVNLIEVERLQLRHPRMVHDLPAGGRRLVQEVDGYEMTIKSGRVTFERGVHTGDLPGRLVRGAQPAPA